LIYSTLIRSRCAAGKNDEEEDERLSEDDDEEATPAFHMKL
jgi:hypothetical protein